MATSEACSAWHVSRKFPVELVVQWEYPPGLQQHHTVVLCLFDVILKQVQVPHSLSEVW